MCAVPLLSSPKKYRVRHLHFGVDVAQHAVQTHNVVDDIIKLEESNVHLGSAHLKRGSCPLLQHHLTQPAHLEEEEEEMDQRRVLQPSLRLVPRNPLTGSS